MSRGDLLRRRLGHPDSPANHHQAPSPPRRMSCLSIEFLRHYQTAHPSLQASELPSAIGRAIDHGRHGRHNHEPEHDLGGLQVFCSSVGAGGTDPG